MTETIRPARLNEREALEDLQLQASLMVMQDRADLLANLDAVDLPADQIADGNVYVCETDDGVVGFGVVLPRTDGDAELDGLFVRPDVWGEGYGRLLVAYGEGLARAAGARQLHVIANAAALGFYTACGFTGVGRVQTQFKPAVAMVKALAPADSG
jgi:GNAT superfamily N-acetyltransferase